MVVGVEEVLDEVGRKDHDLVARVQQRLQHHVQSPAGADGHHDLVVSEGQARLLGQLRGHGGPRLDVSRVGHVAVHPGLGAVGEPPQLREEGDRGLHHRVAQGQVEDVLFAALQPEGGPLLEHAPDHGALLHALFDLPGHGHGVSSAREALAGGEIGRL